MPLDRGLLGRRGLRRIWLPPLVVALVAALTGPAVADPGTRYLDARAPVAARVADLLRRMTVPEKAGQLQQIGLTRIQGECTWTGGALNEQCMTEVLDEQHVGSILSGGGMMPWPNNPREWALMTNAIQRFAIEHSRLRIPVVYGIDAVHGHNTVIGAPMFPHQLGMGATWDAGLAEAAGAATRRALLATGINWNFSPVADIARDQRWGRYYETFAEDPVLAGALTAGMVAGNQRGGRVAATVKHFAGYSEPGNGHDRVPGDMSIRYLQDTILPPYQAGIDAGALTVMVNSGAVNGIPAHASSYLLKDVLRARWGFRGVVISDWADVRALHTAYHVAPDYPAAIALAVNAGVDIVMLPPDDREFTAALLAALERGLISERRLDQAAGRVLALKFTLGLFERPYVDPDAADEIVFAPADRALAERAAAESLVLLRNDGALPFGSQTRRILVTGPSADSLRRQLGGWSISWDGMPEWGATEGTTVLEGLQAAAPDGVAVDHVADAAEAVARAPQYDAVVAVVGEESAAEGFADSPRPALAADQQALVRNLAGTDTPVVEVVISGRPLVLGDAAEPDALLAAWLPGTEGGAAVADALFGAVNPAGRLPVSWPRALGNEPVYYQQLPGTNYGPASGYAPAYEFGAGLSYTTFTTGQVELDRTRARPGDTVRVTVPVANTGDRGGDLVVPVYAGQPVSDVLVPPRRLVGFARVHLAAGERGSVRIAVPLDRLAVTPGDIAAAGRPRVAPGEYLLRVGEASATLTVR